MVKGLISRFKIQKGKEARFEQFMKEAMKFSSRKGNLGAVMMKSLDDPSSYSLVSYWSSKGKWEAFMKEFTAEQKLKEYVSDPPVREWYDTEARLQFGRLLGPKKS